MVFFFFPFGRLMFVEVLLGEEVVTQWEWEGCRYDAADGGALGGRGSQVR